MGPHDQGRPRFFRRLLHWTTKANIKDKDPEAIPTGQNNTLASGTTESFLPHLVEGEGDRGPAIWEKPILSLMGNGEEASEPSLSNMAPEPFPSRLGEEEETGCVATATRSPECVHHELVEGVPATSIRDSECTSPRLATHNGDETEEEQMLQELAAADQAEHRVELEGDNIINLSGNISLNVTLILEDTQYLNARISRLEEDLKKLLNNGQKKDNLQEEEEAGILATTSSTASGSKRIQELPVTSWQGVSRVGAGLLNLGNTCYANAALQCLTYTPPLASYLLARAGGPFCHSPPLCALCALQTHVQHTLMCPGAVVSPVEELLSGFHTYQQEDAHEFLMFTLNALQCLCPQGPECMPGQPRDCDLVQSLFGGLWSSQLCCLRCKCVSTRLEPYLDVVLDIHTTDSLERALEALTEPETLDGDNAYHCEACGDKGPATKTLALQEPSMVLVLVLKCFCGLTGRKLAKTLCYPPELDLSRMVSQPDTGPLPYVLHAVLVHAGASCYQGHYFCFIRAGPDSWFRMDDAKVMACDASAALSQQTYILFYARQSESGLFGASGDATPTGTPPLAAPASRACWAEALHLKGPITLGRRTGSMLSYPPEPVSLQMMP